MDVDDASNIAFEGLYVTVKVLNLIANLGWCCMRAAGGVLYWCGGF
jgi:hypothetical protein